MFKVSLNSIGSSNLARTTQHDIAPKQKGEKEYADITERTVVTK